MAAIPSNQTDLTPATTGNTTGLHVHVPNGQSANVITNPTDNPSPAKSGVQTTVKVVGTPGSAVRFSNPS